MAAAREFLDHAGPDAARCGDRGGIIASMTEPTPVGPLACPFVAFEDDRDARANVPDHRHRCFAEVRPAPRAIAHQEAFCLSPGFAACPTFQDWARREAARAKPPTGAEQHELAGLARPGRGLDPLPAPEHERRDNPRDGGSSPASGAPDDLPPGRPKSRDWAAPPAWAGDADGDPDDAEAPAFLSGGGSAAAAGGASAGLAGGASAGLAGGASAGLAGSRWLNETRSGPPDDPELDDLDRSLEADRVARQARQPVARRGAPADPRDEDDGEPIQPVASAVASPGRRATNQVSRRPASASHDPARPAWERSRRNEAYPTLKTRMGMPAIPRVALALGALVIAAALMIALPFLLNFGGSPGATTPPVSAGPSDSGLSSGGPSSSAAAVATPQVYTVAAGDNLTKIAKKYSLTTAQLLAANPQIKNPNSIKIGDKITIPVAAPSDIINGASPGAS